MAGKIIEGALDPYAVPVLPDVIEHKVERDCGHVQIILGPPSTNAVDHARRIAPILRAEIEKPCEQCAKALVQH